MFKATHKRRATTLSKTLLTAGLLGGAALSTLGAGSAQAVGWIPVDNTLQPLIKTTWTFDGATTGNGSESDLFYTSPTIVDKKLTLLQWVNIPQLFPQLLSNLEFAYEQLDTDYPWHVDLDLNPSASANGSLTYKIDIVGCPDAPSCALPYQGPFFDGVQLRGNFENGATIEKIYGTGWDGTNITGVIDTLNLPPGNENDGPAFGKTLYVQNVWTASPGNVIDNISDNYSQVPAPLPLLGVGAAFGSIRKLRKFSSQLKTFSMG
jgi:hypothetical protein